MEVCHCDTARTLPLLLALVVFLTRVTACLTVTVPMTLLSHGDAFWTNDACSVAGRGSGARERGHCCSAGHGFSPPAVDPKRRGHPDGCEA
jgi:hypothetical protein